MPRRVRPAVVCIRGNIEGRPSVAMTAAEIHHFRSFDRDEPMDEAPPALTWRELPQFWTQIIPDPMEAADGPTPLPQLCPRIPPNDGPDLLGRWGAGTEIGTALFGTEHVSLTQSKLRALHSCAISRSEAATIGGLEIRGRRDSNSPIRTLLH